MDIKKLPEDIILTEMQGHLNTEILANGVPRDLREQFVNRLRELVVDPEDPVRKYNRFSDRAIERLSEARNRVLALQNPQEYFQVPDNLENQLEKIGFKIVTHFTGNEKITVSVQERDASGDWHETAAGNISLPTPDAPAGSTWEKDTEGNLVELYHDVVALWRTLWTNSVNKGRGPGKEARENIDTLKRMLQTR